MYFMHEKVNQLPTEQQEVRLSQGEELPDVRTPKRMGRIALRNAIESAGEAWADSSDADNSGIGTPAELAEFNVFLGPTPTGAYLAPVGRNEKTA
jgi:hypothetical protein